MIYLLDTKVWIEFLRNKNALVVRRIQSHQPSDLRVCTVTAGELYTGCLKSAKPVENRAKVDALLTPYICLPFDLAAAEVFAQIRRYLEAQGTPIGPYDMQIAAIARATGCTLVTHNTAEFARVPAILPEDWELPSSRSSRRRWRRNSGWPPMASTHRLRVSRHGLRASRPAERKNPARSSRR